MSCRLTRRPSRRPSASQSLPLHGVGRVAPGSCLSGVCPRACATRQCTRSGRTGGWSPVEQEQVFGTAEALDEALSESSASQSVNTSFVERHHGTDRSRNARKSRKTYQFSKDWEIHEAMTYFTMYSYNFCWEVRTLRVRREEGGWQPRTPAMAAGLSDHVWSLEEWLAFPAFQST